MEKNKNRNLNNEKEFDEDLIDVNHTSSASDCTGLIPAGLTCEEEVEAYEELYPFIPKAFGDGDLE